MKLLTLPGSMSDVTYAVSLAGAMAPTAFVGARLGAALTHRLPLNAIRWAIAVLLLVAAARMAGFWGE